MNVSPHHQRPTKYPWPGPQSIVGLVVLVVLVVVIGFIIVNWLNDNDEPDPTGMGVTAPLVATDSGGSN